LKTPAIDAALKSKFKRKLPRGPRYITGTITYSFKGPEDPNPDLRGRIGQEVTLRGTFSLRGKIGPFVLVSGNPVYLVAAGSFSWQPYSRLEGKIVSVTGVLHFFKAPVEPDPPGPIAARPPDYFYFEAASAVVKAAERK